MNIALNISAIDRIRYNHHIHVTDAMLSALRHCAETAINDSGAGGGICASALLSAEDNERYDTAFYAADLGRLDRCLCTEVLDTFRLCSYGVTPSSLIQNGHAVLRMIAMQHGLDTGFA